MRATNIRVYVAGPYTRGDVGFNVRAAIDIGEQLWNNGFTPFVPHLSHFWHMIHPHAWCEWLDFDEVWLRQCHVVLRIAGPSDGADRECKLAERLKIPVFHSMEELAKWAGL